MDSQRERREHLVEFDLLRGIAIIAVVYLHAYFTPWPEASHDGLTLLRIAHLFAHGAVPLFLFISAYLESTSSNERPLGYLRYRLRPVWIPVLLWMLATLVYRLVNEGSTGEVWRDLALIDISGQFYFAWLLLVFGVALTQAHRLPDRWLPWAVGIAFAINLATIAWYQSHDSIGGVFSTLAYRNPLAWVFFPVLGYALGRLGRPVVSALAVRAAAAAMTLVAAVYLARGAVADSWPVSYFGVTVFLFSAGGMFVYPRLAGELLKVRAVARPLVWLSKYAFPIYLVHLPFALGFGTRELLGDGADWTNYWLLLHANAAIGLFGSLAFVWSLERLSPRLARTVLGIRRKAFLRRPGNHDVRPPGSAAVTPGPRAER